MPFYRSMLHLSRYCWRTQKVGKDIAKTICQDTAGELKKWGKISPKHGVFASWWGMRTNFHAHSESSPLRTWSSPAVS